MHPNDNGNDLVLETLPSGDVAWLRPEGHEDRFDITDAGRRALAQALALESGPTIAEVMRARS